MAKVFFANPHDAHVHHATLLYWILGFLDKVNLLVLAPVLRASLR